VDGLVDQIEVPFAIWPDARESGDGEDRYHLSPFECNQLIDPTAGPWIGGSPGIAVMIEGRKVQPLRYEMWRGSTDFIRACRPAEVTPPGGGLPVLQYPVNKYTVGYAPQSELAQLDSPPSYVSHTGLLDACEFEAAEGGIPNFERNPNQVAGCFNFFARGRSLAAPDWRLVIPIGYGSGNDWILNDGVPEDERSIIEDIVLYVRYKSRPLTAR